MAALEPCQRDQRDRLATQDLQDPPAAHRRTRLSPLTPEPRARPRSPLPLQTIARWPAGLVAGLPRPTIFSALAGAYGPPRVPSRPPSTATHPGAHRSLHVESATADRRCGAHGARRGPASTHGTAPRQGPRSKPPRAHHPHARVRRISTPASFPRPAGHAPDTRGEGK